MLSHPLIKTVGVCSSVRDLITCLAIEDIRKIIRWQIIIFLKVTWVSAIPKLLQLTIKIFQEMMILIWEIILVKNNQADSIVKTVKLKLKTWAKNKFMDWVS